MSSKLNEKMTRQMLVVICYIWVLIFGLRGYNVGNDTDSYVDFFLNKSSNLGIGYGNVSEDSKLEPGFLLISRVIHMITSSYTVWFTIIASWLWYSIYRLYFKVTEYKKIAAGLLVVFLIINSFITLMVAMRQATAICVFLSGLCLVIENSRNCSKWKDLFSRKKAIVGGLLMLSTVFIHKSMFILLPLIFLASIMNFKKKALISCVIASSVISFLYADNIGILFNTFFIGIGDLGIEFLSSDVMRIYAEDFGGNTQKFTTHIAWVLPAILNIHLSSEKETKNLFFNLYIISVCFFLLFSTTFLIERINTVLILLGFTKFLPTVATQNTKWRIVYIVLIFLMFIVAFNRYNNWPTTDSCIPYQFFWE